MRISKYFSKNVAISDIFSTFAIGFFLFTRIKPNTLWVKTKAFAIISRLAKSLGNSIWNKKHENNM